MLDFAGRVLSTLALFCLGYVAIEGSTAVLAAAVAAVLLIFAAMLVAVRKMRLDQRFADLQSVLAKVACQAHPHDGPYTAAEQALIEEACRRMRMGPWNKTRGHHQP